MIIYLVYFDKSFERILTEEKALEIMQSQYVASFSVACTRNQAVRSWLIHCGPVTPGIGPGTSSANICWMEALWMLSSEWGTLNFRVKQDIQSHGAIWGVEMTEARWNPRCADLAKCGIFKHVPQNTPSGDGNRLMRLGSKQIWEMLD